jgi:hypothetical protein
MGRRTMRLWKRREAGSTSSWLASNTSSCSVRCVRAGALPARWRRELSPAIVCIALVLLVVRPSPPLLSCSQFPAAKAKEAARLRAPDILWRSSRALVPRAALAWPGASIDGSDMCHGARRVLWGFREAPLSFPPTYKFSPVSDDYTAGSKGRAPAWCDRRVPSMPPPLPCPACQRRRWHAARAAVKARGSLRVEPGQGQAQRQSQG